VSGRSILETSTQMAGEALRVLAAAYQEIDRSEVEAVKEVAAGR
jgi:magnesium-transporting ATPase (P-type)